MNLKKKLGLRIRALRKAKGLMQEELAEAAGISITFIGVTERGRNVPSLKTCEKLAGVPGVTLSELFNFEGEDDGWEIRVNKLTKLTTQCGAIQEKRGEMSRLINETCAG